MSAAMFLLAVFIVLAILLLIINVPIMGSLIDGAGKWIKDFFNPNVGGGAGW